jgi:DNA-binding CsgD family transcriptional regulator
MKIITKYREFNIEESDLTEGTIWKPEDFDRDPNLARNLQAVHLRAKGKTLEKIGKKLKLTKERVRQITMITLRKIYRRKRFLLAAQLAGIP